MSIKTTLLKKKLEKTASPMELFVAQQLYTVLEELVKSTHEDSALKIKDLTNKLAVQMANFQIELTKELEAQRDSEIKTIINEGKKAKINVDDVVNQITLRTEKNINEIIQKFNLTSDRIIRNIESMRGPQGIQGPPGKNGQNGSPDTGEQIVSKINKTKGIKIDAIDGLENQLKKIKSINSGAGGGGMGNAQHETKAIGSATTSVNLTYNVSAQGRAIWMYYQGQFLAYGTHYTVSGKTVTLLFTPIDSTYLDITYIRG